MWDFAMEQELETAAATRSKPVGRAAVMAAVGDRRVGDRRYRPEGGDDKPAVGCTEFDPIQKSPTCAKDLATPNGLLLAARIDRRLL